MRRNIIHRWKRCFRYIKRRRRYNKIRNTKLAHFDEYGCIFVHIPKTGGVSVFSSLFGESSGKHRTSKEYRYIYGEKIFNKYFKFSFVRNPWDRLVSAYYFLENGGMHKVDKKWYIDNLSMYSSFRDFVVGWVDIDNVYTWNHFIPQYKFICDGNLVPMVDFVGYFENIEEDYAYVSERLGIQSELVHLNSSGRRDYRDYYDEDTREIVASVYRIDIEIFGYNFDGRIGVKPSSPSRYEAV